MPLPIPFRYPGGKFYALKHLESYWQTSHDEYREPFMGGGSVFFNKPLVEHNWINDLDHELIIAYKVMQDEELRQDLIRIVSNEVATKERWKEIAAFKPQNDLEIAFKYFYLNRTSFSGKLSSPAWGYRPQRSLPPERWHERIYPCGQKLVNTNITNIDFEDVINAEAKGSQVLMFVDPPYFLPASKKHYRNGFNLEDHVRLAETLKKTNHKFFLTYDKCSEISDLYSWANINDINFVYRVENSQTNNGNRKLGFELIITNY